MVNELVRASAVLWCSGASKRVRASSAALGAGVLVLRCARVERWNGGTVERWNGGTVERWNGVGCSGVEVMGQK